MMATETRIPLAAFSLSRRIVDDCLRASCPSSDGTRRYTQTIPLDPTQPVTCSCWGYTTHKHCKHASSAGELGERFRDAHDVQARLSDTGIAEQVAWLSPESVGSVCVAWLSAKRHLDARRQEVAA